MVVLLFLAFGVIAFFQIRLLVKASYWRELAAFSFLYIIAFTLNLLYVLGVDIPSPILSLKFLVEYVVP